MRIFIQYIIINADYFHEDKTIMKRIERICVNIIYESEKL